VRLVSYNIRFGGGRRVALIGAVLAALRPDVVLLQEATDPIAGRQVDIVRDQLL
jgi:endonuclease/exonuclease/phosphatase family metal-dependent hydrolase